MTLILNSGGQGQSRSVIMDSVEAFSGYRNSSTGPTNVVMEQGPGTTPAVNAAPMFPSLLGSQGTIVWDAAIGRLVHRWLSGAGASGMTSQPSSSFAFPMAKQFSLAQSVPVGILPPLRQYRVDYVCRIVLAGTAEVVCGAGQDNPMGVANNNPFVCWSYRSGANGGRWLPRYRQVAAGAIVDGTDSGVSATGGWHKLSILYVEGANPRIEWLLDDVTKFAIAGDASMPVINGIFQMLLAKAIGTPAGTTVEFIETRCIITSV